MRLIVQLYKVVNFASNRPLKLDQYEKNIKIELLDLMSRSWRIQEVLMAKRLFLLFGVNILIVATLGITLTLLQSFGIIPPIGESYQGLFIFCLFWGTGGAFINLMISKFLAKKMMGVRILDPKGSGSEIVQKVHALARRAGLETMPEVGVYESPEVNAFATGPSRSNSLVAVSSGLLNQMSAEETEGVLAHEVAHIANGDMVTMTLVQGVMNAFVMFAARVVASVINNAMRDEEGNGGLGFFAYFGVVMVLDVLFGILAAPVVAGFSRWREFRADNGGARLAGKDKMIAALEALQRNVERIDNSTDQKAFQSMKITNKSGLAALFSTHPPLAQRIET
jgi:heat shock protein HtpX